MNTMSQMSQEARSRIMRGNRGANTKPELAVRRMLHSLGYRFRLHRKDLPESPDIVLPRYRTVIFVHGCFWHQHGGCSLASLPRTRPSFWKEKLRKNQARDKRNQITLEDMGWNVVTLWECETKDPDAMVRRIKDAIETDRCSPPEPSARHQH